MRKIRKEELIKNLDKKQLSAILAGTIALTSLAGCSSNTNVEQTTTTTTTAATTILETTIEETTTTSVVELRENQASEEYMSHAKAVASAMYEANQAYFDEKEFTTEDLENIYYVINGKYFDYNDELLMDSVELNRSFDVIRELVAPQRINEMLQKYSDAEHGYLSYEEYMDEVSASNFYDYNISLVNFFDVTDENEDVRNFVNYYCEEMVKVTENTKNCVSPEEHMIEFFAKVRSAQTGDITDFEGINNYLQDNTANDGYGFVVAAMYKATADYLNTVIDGEYVKVPYKDGTEKVRVGLDYDERILLNAYYLGDLVDYKDIYNAKVLESELFQTMPLTVMCDKQEKIQSEFGFETQVKGNAKTKTL